MKKIVEKNWDYTKHAEFYRYRPNYCPSAIALLKEYVEQNISLNGGGGTKSC